MAVTLNASTSSGFIQTADTSGSLVLQSNGTTVLTVASTGVTATNIQGTIIQGTAVASTSGTSIDFTGIPSWVKRITVMFAGVSTSGTSNPQIQLGDSGGIETSGYNGFTWNNASGGAALSATGFNLFLANASAVIYGSFVLTNVSANLWSVTSSFAATGTSTAMITSGSKTLSGTLDRVRITTVNGTDTFDAGTINIQYEG